MFSAIAVLAQEAGRNGSLDTILWIVAIFRGQVVPGIVLIIVGLRVGPGGVSIFD